MTVKSVDPVEGEFALDGTDMLGASIETSLVAVEVCKSTESITFALDLQYALDFA